MWELPVVGGGGGTETPEEPVAPSSLPTLPLSSFASLLPSPSPAPDSRKRRQVMSDSGSGMGLGSGDGLVPEPLGEITGIYAYMGTEKLDKYAARPKENNVTRFKVRG